MNNEWGDWINSYLKHDPMNLSLFFLCICMSVCVCLYVCINKWTKIASVQAIEMFARLAGFISLLPIDGMQYTSIGSLC